MRAGCRIGLGLAALPLMVAWPAHTYGWDEEGHVIVTRVAIRSMPPDMPDWLRTPQVQARLEYLCNEPDRWRGENHTQLNHVNNPDHYIDEEKLHPYGLSLKRLPLLRREFTDLLATRAALCPDGLGSWDASKDKDYISRNPGMLPYRIAELQWTIASSWSTLKAYERHRDRVSDEMIENARQNIVFHMGLLSHYVGDGSQPLHATQHHHGWVGPNPEGYTTDIHFHAYIDGGVLARHGLTRDALPGPARPAVRLDPDDYWQSTCDYLYATYEQVEPLYRLEKSGALNGPEGKRFIEERLLTGAAMLAGVWDAAYRGARVDEYLERRLSGRSTSRPASRPIAP